MEIEEALPLLSLNHVSVLCRSVWESVRFYVDVLGFLLIKRPSSFKFNGAWLVPYFASLPFSVLYISHAILCPLFCLNEYLIKGYNFCGCRLYNYGIGIHLIENPNIDEFDTSMIESRPINPKDNHISFQVIKLCLLICFKLQLWLHYYL